MDRIALGSGTVYIMPYVQGSAIPAHSAMCVPANVLGLIKGGASIEYSAETYTAEDDFGKAKKIRMTKETAKFKTGVITFNGEVLAKLCQTARVTDNAAIRTVKIGGIEQYANTKYVITFHHKDAQDGDIWLTIVGSNTSGFTLSFAQNKETVIDAEFEAAPNDAEGTLIIYEEEMK